MRDGSDQTFHHEGHEVARRKTNSFYFAPDLPLFFVLSFVTFVSFVVKALNKVIADANLKKRIYGVILLQLLNWCLPANLR
jgi:hypothetical protein